MTPNFNRYLSGGLVCVMVVVAASRELSAQRVTGSVQPPFNAYVFCVDTSLSLLTHEFDRSKQVLKDVVDRKVTYHDVVWLLELQDRATPGSPFTMPERVPRRSLQGTVESLPEAKRRLTAAIDDLVQHGATTDIHRPVERGLQLLHGMPRAESRSVTVIADFIQDLPGGRMSPLPTRATPGITARNIRVNLLLAQPKPEYLTRLNISPPQLYQIVIEHWRPYFNTLGSAETSVSLLEGVVIRSSR